MAEQKATYSDLLLAVKNTICAARIKVSHTVNCELIDLYWNIGKEIVERQELHGWGKSIVEQLATDICKEFTGNNGFSQSNIWRMRSFYLSCRDNVNLVQLAREVPWFSNVMIFEKIKDGAAREYYLKMTAQMGWSRNVLHNQIKAQAFERHVMSPKQHNFAKTLPQYLAEQADEAMKDVYMLDFLGISKPVVEREMERRMVNRIRDVILELG